MDKDIIDSFSDAFLNVMPQLGFTEVSLQSQEECGKRITEPGVVVIIGIIGDLHGNIILAMDETTAKKVASTMMFMEVEAFDEMAQSAVSELGNMLAANACINLSGKEITADISTPTLMYGSFNATASFDNVMRIQLLADGFPFSIYVSLQQK